MAVFKRFLVCKAVFSGYNLYRNNKKGYKL